EWIEGSELIVVSNSSTDNTNRVLANFKIDNRIKVYIRDDISSKIEAVNFAVSIALHEILVFSDCRQVMKIGSIKCLLSNFHDEKVGTVTAKINDGDKFSMRKILNFISIKESEKGT